RVRDWVGSSADSGADSNEWRKSKLNRALTQAAQKVAEEWDREITAKILTLMEHAGARVAAAETALVRLQEFCHTASQEQRQRLTQMASRTAQLWQQVEASVVDCYTGRGGFLGLGGRSPRRLLRGFLDALAQYSRQRYQEELAMACRQVFGLLHGRL